MAYPSTSITMSALPDIQENHLSRRHDLDWLRVLVFGLLIFYHIGMLYVANWGFHYKSQYLSQPLEGLMLLVNQWRMPLLWVISGISIRFVLQKMSAFKFLAARSLRLLLPLLFGILVVVPPQLYVEMTGKGELDMSYWQFYQVFFDLDNPVFDKYQPGILPHIDVNHLWYLRELWTYSLIVLCLSPLLNSRFVQSGVDWFANKAGLAGLFLLPLLPLIAINIMVPDENRNQIGFTFLIYGYLIGWNERLWGQIKQHRRALLLIALASYIAILLAYFIVWFDPVLKAMWWAEWLGLIVFVNAWSGVLALLGYASVYLNKPSAKLQYLNDAVLPYYILHQTIIIVMAYWLSSFRLGPVLEPLVIIAVTFAGCVLAYEIIRRVTLLRPLFGLKWHSGKADLGKGTSDLGYRLRSVLAYLLVLPLALKLIIF
jgi:surface polysaccharide O-acyltransferase-like enzyme